MTNAGTSRDDAEARVKECYSTWGDSYYEDYYSAAAAYPPVHADLLRRLLVEAGAKKVIDAGCGPASFLRDLPEGIEGFGFDLTPEMIASGKAFVPEPDRLWVGSVLDAASFQHPSGSPVEFDAGVCVGVLPHVPEDADEVVLANLLRAVRPGGLVVVEARNELFALFTLNRYSSDLFRERLIPAERLRATAGEGDDVDAALSAVERQFRMDLPPVRAGKQGEPGYDEVLSRTHNPMVLRQQAERAGWHDVRVLFYHFHALPPLAGGAAPAATRQVSLEMEADPEDWRGHFMASAFLVVGTRPS